MPEYAPHDPDDIETREEVSRALRLRFHFPGWKPKKSLPQDEGPKNNRRGRERPRWHKRRR